LGGDTVAGAAAVVFGAVATVAVIGNDEPASTAVILAAPSSPDAAGRANIAPMDSGSRSLDISGLPPAPAGSYYQGWLRNEDGDAVTIGTFHGREGTDDIILWSGVDVADYHAHRHDPARAGRRGIIRSGRVARRDPCRLTCARSRTSTSTGYVVAARPGQAVHGGHVTDPSCPTIP
jgi:hypothetical protein